jgi:hypothetical protein
MNKSTTLSPLEKLEYAARELRLANDDAERQQELENEQRETVFAVGSLARARR